MNPSSLPPKPEPPEPWECCDSGCTSCVWTLHAEALARWQAEVAAIRATSPDADADDPALPPD